LGVGLLWLTGCGRPEITLPPVKAPPKLVDDTGYFRAQPVGAPVEGHPWIAHVKPVDLDRDGRMDILVCDAQKNQLTWIRQKSPAEFEEIVLAADIPALVHVEAVDLNGDGHLDLLVAVMGQIFPNNDQIGEVLIFENDGRQHFTKHIIAEHIARVTDVQAADLNGDGRLDLAVGQFGYDQGEVQWMENKGGWQFESHHLLNLSGTINVVIADFNGDRTPDIAAIVSQQWEEIHLFENNGTGSFTDKVIWGSTNEDYASSGMSLCDLNRDGRPDLLFSNGDGYGPTTLPGPRPWHGVQWLENLGQGFFRFHRIGDLGGAYSPVGVDFDGDGFIDVVAISAFNDWSRPDSISLMWFRNDGHEKFTPHVLSYTPTHLTTLAAADLDGSGRPSLVTGALHAYPPFDRQSRVLIWRRTP